QLRKTSREGERSNLRVSIKAQRHIRNRPYRQLKMSLTMPVLNSACAGQIMSVRARENGTWVPSLSFRRMRLHGGRARPVLPAKA
ncbi:hypothetical protein, partial [Burkholderia cenocepacia]|uniref:hypothetical protein n=1 Tax=Burkholderia cenocepacia TaxID=95486 RepID=UPI00222FC919